MRVVLQRVSEASVEVEDQLISRIDRGFLVLVGFTHSDTEDNLLWMARKIIGLRVFEDDAGKMNLSLQDVGGEILCVSQFTLYADAAQGRRPSFTAAAPPELALNLYDRFCALLEEGGIRVSRGKFGARMKVSLINDGPVTILLP